MSAQWSTHFLLISAAIGWDDVKISQLKTDYSQVDQYDTGQI